MEFNGTFFVVIISFLVFVYLMNKVLYEPVRKIVKERKVLIAGNYSVAEDNDTKTKNLSETREKRIDEARDDARVKYNETLNEFKSKRADAVNKATEDAKEELQTAYQNLENVSNDAKQNLKFQITSIAEDIAEKILGYRSEVSEFDNDEIDNILYR